jgi:hypothetical protein
MAENRTDPGMNRWFVPASGPGFALDSMLIIFGEIFAIFFMQHWGKLMQFIGNHLEVNPTIPGECRSPQIMLMERRC